MSTGGSVTAWIRQLKEGDEAPLERLHGRYWPALVDLARRRLRRVPCRGADDEDIAQEAFWGFYRSLRSGRLPRLRNRADLLALLTHIIACKAVNQFEAEAALKRGAHRVRDEAGLGSLALEQAPGASPTPLEQALLHDCYQHYVDGLPEALRGFAEHYLAGCTHPEIAQHMGCVSRTVDRKIALILARWQAMAAASLGQAEAREP